MKRFLIATVTAIVLGTSAFAAEVGVSLSVGEPGFFGRLDIGNFPQPQVLNRQPMMIERVPMERPPIYLRVPPGHAKHWSKHCREYNACGERVYFVQDNWYSREYVPRYQEQQRNRHEMHRPERHEDRRDESRNKDHDQKGDHRGKEHDRDR